MPVKKLVQELQPVQVYVVLTLAILFFITELVVSHFTHALILLMDSYHTLCNIIALSGCIMTMKYCNNEQSPETNIKTTESANSIEESGKPACRDKKNKKASSRNSKQERKLRNTFGWTRIDVVTMLTCCVFLGSFSFSVYVEALQTLAHIDHQDAIHHPFSVLCIGAAGLLLNGVCFLLIGGFTFHQGSFLYVTESGDVILNKVVANDSILKGQRRLSRTRNIYSSPPKKRQGIWETTRDIIGCGLVMICSLVVLFTDQHIAKFADPVASIISATILVILSYPYIKESCLILLQTIPDTIDIDTMRKELVNHFPDIVSIHDFHIWQLTASKVISTIHIVFENPKVFRSTMEEIKEFFAESGVTQVTIQPEFFQQHASLESLNDKLPPVCLVACQEEQCKINHCCPSFPELDKLRSSTDEMIIYSENSTPTLKSVKVIDDELNSLQSYRSLNTIDNKEQCKVHNGVVKDAQSNKMTEKIVEKIPLKNDQQPLKDCENNNVVKPPLLQTPITRKNRKNNLAEKPTAKDGNDNSTDHKSTSKSNDKKT